MPPEMPDDSVQLQMVRRYARMMREQQAKREGQRVGAKERRATARQVVETAVDAVKPTKPAT